jgi:two-component system, LytTR family, response regulator
MNQIRVVVADDEPLARRGVRQLLAEHPDMTVVAECRNGPETLRALETLSPDVIFLDVQMPQMDGFEVIRVRGAHRMPTVVFVTAHDDFAVQAFETHALDYLVKPLNVDRFESTVRWVRSRLKLIHDAATVPQLEALLAAEQVARKRNEIKRLVVSTETGDLVLSPDEIDWIGADDYYACLHVGTRTHMLRESLTSLQTRLNPAHFARVHRSVIVQLDRIRELLSSIRGGEIVLKNGSRLPVSRRSRAMVRGLLREKDRQSTAAR